MKEMVVPKRKASIIINSLSGGVVPRVGLGYLSVGREKEIKALLNDIKIIENGGSVFRLISGRYGSGKTFLLQTIKEHLLYKGFVVMDCDFTPNRSLVGTGNRKRGLVTFKNLIANISIKSCQEGGGLESILEDYFENIYENSRIDFPLATKDELIKYEKKELSNSLLCVRSLVHGIDFSNIILRYFNAYLNDDIEEKNKILKWLRGEYGSKGEVKKELNVFEYITDENWFDYIKLYTTFFNNMGYSGVYIMFDELVNLYRITSFNYRLKNYEKILGMYNDALQGRIKKLGIIMAGTPESIYDSQKGLFSYEALKSRLYVADTSNHLNNLFNPIITVTELSQSDIIILLEKISSIHSIVYDYEQEITIDDIVEFLEYLYENSNVVITVRSIIRDFLALLNLKLENNDEEFCALIGQILISNDEESQYYFK